MLIASIQRLRERLAFLKLYFAERHEQERSLFPRFFYYNLAGKFSLADSKAAILQRRLSILGSEVCSMLVEWDNMELRPQYEEQINFLISKINLSKDLLEIEGSLSMPLRKMDFKVQAELSIWLQIYRAGIKHFCGAAPDANYPQVKLNDIKQGIDKIRRTNVKDDTSLNELVALLDRRELFDYKAAASTTFFRGRLN